MRYSNILIALLAAFSMNTAAWAGADSTVEDDVDSMHQAKKEFDKTIGYKGDLLNIQERLAVIGYYPSYLVDGQNETITREAIMRFQKDYGLKPNGDFDARTATALNYYTGTQHIMPVPHYRTVYHYVIPTYYRGHY